MISGLIGILAFIIGGIISIACAAFWVWMLIHALTNKRLSDGEKIAWVLVVIFLPFLGSILYFFIGRPKAV